MTREELIDGLYDVKNWHCNGDERLHTLVTEAIKALEQEPKIVNLGDNVVYGPDGNLYKITVSSGKDHEQEPCEEELDFVQEHKKISCNLIVEPCEDAISRQAVNEIINDIRDCISVEGYWAFLERLKKLPPVNPQTKTGHWIFDEILDKHYYCSECKSMGVDYWDFCPNCGCRMVEPQESEVRDADSN